MQPWQQNPNQAGRSIFMSSVIGLSNVIALSAAVFWIISERQKRNGGERGI